MSIKKYQTVNKEGKKIFVTIPEDEKEVTAAFFFTDKERELIKNALQQISSPAFPEDKELIKSISKKLSLGRIK